MLYPEVVPHSSGIDESQKSLVSAAAAAAYEFVSQQEGIPFESVAVGRNCKQVTRFMVQTMASSDFCPQFDYAITLFPDDVKATTKHDNIVHLYGELDALVSDKELVFDGTWQQFLPEELRLTAVPSVLLGTRRQVIEHAKASGITDETTLKLWLPSYMRHS